MSKVFEQFYEWSNEHFELFVGAIIGVLIMAAIYTPSDEPQYKYDLNEDGVIDIKDMLLVQEYILENEGCECDE